MQCMASEIWHSPQPGTAYVSPVMQMVNRFVSAITEETSSGDEHTVESDVSDDDVEVEEQVGQRHSQS